MKKSLDYYLKQAQGLALDINEGRWALAEIALDMRTDKIDGWAEKLAYLPNIRREPRTMRNWAQVADFGHSLRRSFQLPFSFFSVASNFANRIELTVLEDALEVAESEAGITHEAFAAQLRDMVGMTPEGPDLRRTLADLTRARERLGEIGKRTGLPNGTYLALEQAQEALQGGLEALEGILEASGEGETAGKSSQGCISSLDGEFEFMFAEGERVTI